MIAYLLLVVGVILALAGVSFIYWPAALILAGAALIALALILDLPTGRSRT